MAARNPSPPPSATQARNDETASASLPAFPRPAIVGTRSPGPVTQATAVYANRLRPNPDAYQKFSLDDPWGI